MKTSVETVDEVTRKLTVEVEPKRVKQAFDRAARELAKQVDLPGFRPGKAPRRLLEQRFGSGVIAQSAMEDALSGYYAEALEAEELTPIAQPEVDVDTFDETDGATFTATLEVRPEVELPDHNGIDVTFPEWDVDDADVDEHLEQLRDRFAEVDEVEREARDGDLVTLSLRVEVDGEELESAHVEDALYEIGSQGVTPKLDEELIGTSAGEELSYDDALPEGFPEHGGQQATFHVTVTDVREKTLPELDDDFASSASEFDTIAELRADVRSSLLARSVTSAQHELRAKVLEAYLATVEVTLPPAMLEESEHNQLHQLQPQADELGVEVHELLDADEELRERFESEAGEQAERTVKAQIVLDQLAQDLEVDLDPADVEAEISRHAQINGMPPEQVAQVVQQQGSLPAMLGDIMRRKAIDAIVAAADVDGGPSEDVLRELDLLDEDDEAGTEGEDAPGLIVPGEEGDDAEGGQELTVPGRD